MTWTALVLAGERAPGADPVAQATGAPCKALAPVAGRPMISWVLDALAGVDAVGRVLVSIGAEAPALPEGPAERIPSGESPASSVLEVLDRVGGPLLVTTADHPLLTAPLIAEFLTLAEAEGAAVTAGIAERRHVEQAGSTARRTYLKLSDGEISGCNLFALSGPEARPAVAAWRSFESLRKRPLAMARRIGPGTLARYALGRLDRAALMRAASRSFGTSCALVPLTDPVAAHDVDKPADLAFAEHLLTRGKAPG